MPQVLMVNTSHTQDKHLGFKSGQTKVHRLVGIIPKQSLMFYGSKESKRDRDWIFLIVNQASSGLSNFWKSKSQN